MKHVKFLLAAVILLYGFFNIESVYAANPKSEPSTINYSIDIEDSALENASLLSVNQYIKGDRQITETIYLLPDGNTITDVLDVSAVAPMSPSGSDTVSRTRKISNWGSITIEASFAWYTEGMFSYVKCSSMSATKNLNSGVTVSQWDTDYTSKYVSIGKATAQVKYRFYQTNMPTQDTDGTFKITCTDTGTISDNN